MTIEMTSKERIIAALNGQPYDRLPFCPFLAYFWDTQPAEFTSRGIEGQLSFLHEIGADPLWRGDAWGAPCPTHVVLDGVTTRTSYTDDKTYVEVMTPVGTLTSVYQETPVSQTTFLVEYPLKAKADFETQLWVEEHKSIEWADQAAVHEAVSREGLALGMIIPEGRTAWARLIQKLAGTEALTYALADFPETVAALLTAMTENDLTAVRMATESSYDYFLSWENTSTQNYSPAMFRQYNAPELTAWCELINNAGKHLIHHACGHLAGLLKDIKACGVAAIESIATPPTGNISLREARRIAGRDFGIVGGIEPTHLLNLSLKELTPYVEQVITDCQGGPFVLGNSDSCPPGVTWEKFKLVSAIARCFH